MTDKLRTPLLRCDHLHEFSVNLPSITSGGSVWSRVLSTPVSCFHFPTCSNIKSLNHLRSQPITSTLNPLSPDFCRTGSLTYVGQALPPNYPSAHMPPKLRRTKHLPQLRFCVHAVLASSGKALIPNYASALMPPKLRRAKH